MERLVVSTGFWLFGAESLEQCCLLWASQRATLEGAAVLVVALIKKADRFLKPPTETAIPNHGIATMMTPE